MRRLMLLALLVSSPAMAGSNRDEARAAEDRWETCIKANARRMAGRAQVETVVEAAFGKCTAEEGEFRDRLQKWSQPFGFGGGGYRGEELERQMEVERQRIRRETAGAILDL